MAFLSVSVSFDASEASNICVLFINDWGVNPAANNLKRDACEWENLESIFHPEAYIYTTWTGRTHHKDFIKASQAGMDKGAFIMHRCHGISTDINIDATRAVTKMKATITQRFDLDGCEADAESDCRFCFFWLKSSNGDWQARFVRHWYEKVCCPIPKTQPGTERDGPKTNIGRIN